MPESTEELGRKYPITMVEPDPAWPERYEKEVQFLRSHFASDLIPRIEHLWIAGQQRFEPGHIPRVGRGMDLSRLDGKPANAPCNDDAAGNRMSAHTPIPSVIARLRRT